MEKLIFDVPRGFSRQDIAEMLNAYLLGSKAFENQRRDRDGDRAHGPYPQNKGRDDHWQLDGSNDYWLHFEESGKAWLNHRYLSQRPRAEAVMNLFVLTHLR
jgi:hypothetical protein